MVIFMEKNYFQGYFNKKNPVDSLSLSPTRSETTRRNGQEASEKNLNPTFERANAHLIGSETINL